MTRDEARLLFMEMTETYSLRRHARTVELVMEALAIHFNEDPEIFAMTGLLHDADYEKHPDVHPQVIVKKLEALGENEMAHAIAGHYTKWNVARNSLLDKCIVAADEITGFIVAVALIRPTKIVGIKVKSVMKKFKTSTFAAKVDREECIKGAALLGWTIQELIAFIIPVLEKNKEELDLI
ncbi:MAG: HD domain-containing protein [Saprospiraceae bacterium]|nr:HD domain-containing protein [Bacteroidia bacterium]NNE15881.1 HD domain-containing protein [Saprospiraceae bacterium]NNL92823.1 HD domain-containing protein [Saprospiraceae bacterium]